MSRPTHLCQTHSTAWPLSQLPTKLRRMSAPLLLLLLLLLLPRCGATVTGLGELAKVLELYRQLAKGHPENQAYSFRFAYFLLLSGDAAGAAKWARAALHAQVEHAADYGPALWVLGITERGGLHRPAQPTDKTTGFGALRAKVLLNPPSTAWLE